MSTRITVIGSTGLIGSEFLRNVEEGEYESVTAITRREIDGLLGKPFIRQVIHDFKDLESMRPDLKADVLVCALGTTIKTAGSQERFFEVDHDLPLKLAKIAREEGCKRFILVSSVGADARSKTFYLRVKGQLEAALKDIGFEALHILQPSMLLGDRLERRPGEALGKIVMKPLSILIPWNYKPIHARQVSAKIRQLSLSTDSGNHVWLGRSLFNVN